MTENIKGAAKFAPIILTTCCLVPKKWTIYSISICENDVTQAEKFACKIKSHQTALKLNRYENS